MHRGSVLALILAGGEGGRLEVLTQERAKPALPFAGTYRLIDFVLSNCVHSGIADVWVVQQYEPHSLSDHLTNGRPWDLDRTHGGLVVLHPHQGRSESGFYAGNADAIYRNKRELRDFGAETLLVLSADHIYRLDLRALIDAHTGSGADVTMVTTRVERAEASRFGVVEIGADGKVARFTYKPEEPEGDTVTTEVFAYRTEALLDALDALAAEAGPGEDGEEPALSDFGDELLPRFVEAGTARAFELEGYWRDVGTIESYLRSHMELLEPEPALILDDRSWPILTASAQRPSARFAAGARVEASIVSSGSRIEGTVVHSVLAPGVVVEAGAEVRDSILLEDVVVRAGARVGCAILDSEVEVGAGARVGAEEGCSPETVVLVGQRARIEPGSRVEPGARVDPGAADQ